MMSIGLVNAQNATEENTCEIKNEVGRKILHEQTSRLIAGGRGGCIDGRTVTEFNNDRSAREFSDNLKSDPWATAIICAVITAVITKDPNKSFGAGILCSGLTADANIDQLRAGDWFVERGSGCAMGGVGGQNNYTLALALGQRDGQRKVLFVLSSNVPGLNGILPTREAPEIIKQAISEELKAYTERKSQPLNCDHCRVVSPVGQTDSSPKSFEYKVGTSCPMKPFIPSRQVGCANQLSNIAGTYSAAWGPIKCTSSGGGATCCYGSNCKWSLQLALDNTGQKLTGTWDHNDGSTGPVEFTLNDLCELSSGKYGRKLGNLTSGWSVSGKIDDRTVSSNIDDKKAQSPKCESFCVEWVCGVTGSGCSKLGNSCAGATRRETICGKGCKTQC